MDYQEQLKRMGKWEEYGEPEPEPEMIDWEQRRYEIAKEVLPTIIKEYPDDIPMAKMAEDAAIFASLLIKKLREPTMWSV
jgi:hypothetical protein